MKKGRIDNHEHETSEDLNENVQNQNNIAFENVQPFINHVRAISSQMIQKPVISITFEEKMI